MTTDITSSGTRIADLLSTAASHRPEATALVVTENRTPISYGSLTRLVDDLAGQLADGGLRPGDRVGLRAPSSAEFVVGLFAASRAGLVAVPLDPALPVADQQARIRAAGARVVVVGDREPAATGDARFPSWPISVAVGGGDVGVHLDTSADPYPPASAPDDLSPDDALIMFTGGTTGTPKMVPWTHDNIATSVRNVIATYGLGPDDATVAVMPLFHGHGLIATLLSTLASGGAVLVPARGKFSAHTFADDVRRRPRHLVHRGADDSSDPA